VPRKPSSTSKLTSRCRDCVPDWEDAGCCLIASTFPTKTIEDMPTASHAGRSPTQLHDKAALPARHAITRVQATCEKRISLSYNEEEGMATKTVDVTVGRAIVADMWGYRKVLGGRLSSQRASAGHI
jgi:hypothetical protein